MRRIGLHAVAGVAGTAAILATGCTNLHQAGNLVGINKQAQLKPAVEYVNSQPPIPAVTDGAEFPSEELAPPYYGGTPASPSANYRGEPDCQIYGEPTCQAPFLREPTCEAPIWQEPTCAGPGMGPARNGRGGLWNQGPCNQGPCGQGPCGQGPCPCANCAKEEHIHEAVPAPEQEHGCLTFGGGHVSIPLPTIQFPGFFRVPAYRQALIPVAEATYVGVPAAAPASAVAASVVPVAAVAAAPAAPAIPVQIVVQEQAADASAASAASAPCETVTICKEELMALRIKAGLSPSASAAAVPTPAAAADASAEEIDALRTQVQQYQKEIDDLINDIKAQSGQP